jgi:hypothetical protein
MKIKNQVIFLFLLLGILQVGCKKYPWDKCDVGRGDNFVDTRFFPNFHTFTLDIPAEIILTPDTNLEFSKIEIFGQRNVTSEISATESNGEVRVSFDGCFKSHNDIEFRIYTPWIREFKLNSASRLKSTKAIYGSSLRLTVNQGTSINLVCILDSLYSDLKSAGNVILNGYVRQQDVIIGSNTNYDAKELISDTCRIEMPSAGTANVYATGLVKATVSGSGLLNIFGEDTLHIDSTVTGSGQINDQRF